MSEEKFFKDSPENNIFTQIIQKYIPFWPLFLVTISIALVVTYIYLRSQQLIFVSDAKVLLKDPNKGAGDSKVLDALNIFSETKIVENEILVLKSSSLMQEVVGTLGLYATVYNQGNIRVEELYKYNSPVWFQCSQTQRLHNTKRFYFKVNWEKKQVYINNTNVPFDSLVFIEEMPLRVIANPQYDKTLTGKNYYVTFNSIPETASEIIGNLNITAISNNSTVLNVSLETPVVEKGEDVLSNLFNVYIKFGIEDKNQISAKTLAFIDQQLKLVTGQLDTVERRTANYQSQQSAVDLTTQSGQLITSAQELDKRKSQLDLQLNVINEVNNYVLNKNNKPGTVPATQLINDPTLSALLTKLYDAEMQYDRVKSIAGEKSDVVINFQQQINRYKNDILENIGNIKRNLSAERDMVNSNIGQSNSLLRQIPRKEVGMIQIDRKQGTISSIYNYLLQKRMETALSSASTSADLRIIDAPKSYGPVRPVSSKYYTMGAIAGILFSIFIILLKEQLNRKVLFRSEIEEKTKVPVLGEIIQVTSKDPIVIGEGKRTVIAEQIRSLRTNLSFMGLNENNKTILITSSVSGEGKSFVAINLAISFTLTGKKVALLEMDLRKPKLSKMLHINRDLGISNFLIGKATIDNIVKETEHKNLFLVSSGPIPPNPSELIISNKFKEMMTLLEERFDYIIIDTAPVGPVSDSQLLKEYANTTIFVVRHNVTPKGYLRMIEDLKNQKKFKNLCIIFNGLKKRGFSYGGYGYGGYGQGYGYGYGSTGNGYYVNDDNKKTFSSRFKNIFSK